MEDRCSNLQTGLLHRETTGKEAVDGTGPYQVDSNSASKQEAQVDVDGVVLVLDDPRQTANDGTDNEGEDQQGLEQLGRVCQSAVEVHLWTHEFIDLFSIVLLIAALFGI